MSYRKTVSIEIGPERIRAVELMDGRKNANVFNVLEFDTPEGCVDNGYITDPEKLGEILRSRFDEAGILTASTVFSVISEDILVGGAEIERGRKKDIDQEVVAKAQELFGLSGPHVREEDNPAEDSAESGESPEDADTAAPPAEQDTEKGISVDEYYTAYQEQDDSVNDWAMNVIIYAAPRDLIDSYYRLAECAQLNTYAADYSGNSIFQWTRKAFGGESVMMVDLRRDGSTATIVTDGTLRVQVDLMSNTGHLLENIRDYEELLEMHEPEAEDTDPEEEEGAEEERQAEENRNADFSLSRDMIVRASAGLVEELNGIASEFLSENVEEYIDVIMLSTDGEGSMVLAEEIEQKTGIETITLEEAPKGAMVKDLKSFRDLETGNFLGVIGSVIRPLVFRQPQENSEYSAHERKDMITRIILIVVVACLLATAALCVTYFILRSHNKALHSSLSKIKYVEDIYKEYQEAEENNREIRALDHSTSQKNELLSQMFSDLESKMPSNSKITSMNSSDDMVTFSVRAGDKEAAAQFIMQLRKIDYLTDINVSDLTDTEDSAGNDSVDFTISAYLTGEALEDSEKSDGANDDGIGSGNYRNNGDDEEDDEDGNGRSSSRRSEESDALGQTVSFHSQDA